ncbi:MAG: hypothetical protein OEZ39_10705 [Gammaproteobacteria bacterium]|nr:hypothetical protein [Gammaproteobacteria bacterium]MDH5652313.1 hypothetical protein [Gammaproteobacteria bacterium]
MNQQEFQNQYRRRRRFIDKQVQGKLLWGLITIELLLFASGMLVVYLDMQGTLEENMYRVHQLTPGGRPLLFRELLITVPWIILININLMIVADRIWKRNVQLIVAQLQAVLEKVRKLDLRSLTIDAEQHEVLKNAESWFAIERGRYHSIQSGANQLPDQVIFSNQGQVNQLRNQLAELQDQLPHR